MKKLTASMVAALGRAVAGEDRMIPERYDPGPPPFIVPERRWLVPPGVYVPNGREYQTAHALRRRGLFEGHFGSPGGYQITRRGRAALKRALGEVA
jgi:hypothetical protein